MSLRYQVALTSVPFDNTYQNVIRFNSREEQAEYFGLSSLFCKNAIDNGECVNVNFDAGSLIRTSIFFISQENTAAGLLGKNYAIIRDTQEGAQSEYYYYFITDSRLNSSKQIQLDIELDIYQTYYQDITFGDCFINKAHINRFDENLHFDFTQNSNLYTREPIRDTPKRLKSRDKIKFRWLPDEADSGIDFISEHIELWGYVYLKPREAGYKAIKSDGTEGTYNTNTELFGAGQSALSASNLAYPYIIICAPIINDAIYNISFNDDDNNFKWTWQAVLDFIQNNGGEEWIYMLKISIRPPFNPTSTLDKYAAVSDYNLPLKLSKYTGQDFYCYGPNYDRQIIAKPTTTSDDCLMILYHDYPDAYEINYKLPYKFSFNKAEIQGNHNAELNPKIFSSDIKEMRLYLAGQSVEYEIIKLGEDHIRLLYTELMSPDITVGYLRIKPDTESAYGLYVDGVQNNLTGLCVRLDLSMPYAVNALDTYLANNKNFFQQRSITLDYKKKGATIQYGESIADAASSGMLGFASSARNGSILGAIGSLVNMSKKTAFSTADYMYNLEGIENELIQSDLSLDNMRSQPESISNANGNMFFMVALDGLSIFVEHYEALPRDIKSADNQMNLYGYAYNQLDNIKNVDNIRKYFNYVAAELQTLQCTYGLSNEVMQMYRAIFSRGVRMWNNTDQLFKYEKENYENWLDEA